MRGSLRVHVYLPLQYARRRVRRLQQRRVWLSRSREADPGGRGAVPRLQRPWMVPDRLPLGSGAVDGWLQPAVAGDPDDRHVVAGGSAHLSARTPGLGFIRRGDRGDSRARWPGTAPLQLSETGAVRGRRVAGVALRGP